MLQEPGEAVESFSIVNGTPNDSELTALSAVLAQVDARARAEAAGVYAPHNRWGTGRTLAGRPVYNPSAYRNAHFD